MTSAIQCEACGYDLAGIEVEGVCPECARPVAANNGYRPGSPWQRNPSLDAWLVTGLRMCVRPRAFWSAVELEFPRSWNLLVVNVAIASLLVGVASTIGAASAIGGRAAGSLMGGILLAVPAFVIMFAITVLCVALVRVLTPGAERMAVRAAVGHASFLWILAGPAVLVAVREPALAALLAIPAAGVIWLGAVGARRLRYVAEAAP